MSLDAPLDRPLARLGSRQFRHLPPRDSIAPAIVRALAAATALAILGFFLDTEWPLSQFAFTCGVTLAIASALVVATRRVLVAAVLVAGLVFVVAVAGMVKGRHMSMSVHAYDLFFYFGSRSTLGYLWTDYRGYIAGLFAVLVLVPVGALFLYRLDTTRVPRQRALAVFVVSALVAAAGSHAMGARRHMHNFQTHAAFVSAFYLSWRETLETLWRGGLIEASAHARGLMLTGDAPCGPGPRPHIVLIHQESVVPPSLFPTLGYDGTMDRFFRSHDGRIHRLGVETYGGASWLTEFSILAGVSTYSFGNMRTFVQTLMQGRIRHGLPQVLARCGYRNVVFYPMDGNFVSNAAFYRSVGIKEVIDRKAQGTTSYRERDRFYYANALALIRAHMAESDAPLFVYIQTMSNHWPYDITFEPHEDVAGGAPGTDPEMHEYLRRLSLGQRDYDWLKGELAQRFPKAPFLMVHYGDHHPTATRTLLGKDASAEAEDVDPARGSLGLQTYFAIEGVGFRPRTQMPPYPVVDVPYLGLLTLEAAGIALDDAFFERRRLLHLCQGRYADCAARNEVLSFHRRLIDSGLIDTR